MRTQKQIEQKRLELINSLKENLGKELEFNINGQIHRLNWVLELAEDY